MVEATIFVIGSAVILWVSIPSLRRPGSHGFYRFFAWEIILGAVVLNLRGWFANPFAWYQIISWILLFAAFVPLIYGVVLLRVAGKPTDELEATTQLVTKGIYRVIRHPLYASLLYLAWGIFFKSPSLLDGCLAAVASTFLYATARADERECVEKFGGIIHTLHEDNQDVRPLHFLDLRATVVPFRRLLKGLTRLQYPRFPPMLRDNLQPDG